MDNSKNTKNTKTSPDDIQLTGCPVNSRTAKTIQMAHGSGGKLSSDLISNLFVKAFSNPHLDQLDDQALLNIEGTRLAFSTDSYVVDPIFFPGGDIGELAVNGTVNDICMSGAKPLYLSVGFIIEEGLAMDDLARIVQSIKLAAEKAGVKIVTGDTKVVDRGKGDKLFINTAGVGLVEHKYKISADNLQVGDKIIVSGTLADHGMTILSKRQGLSFESSIESDCAALNGLVEHMLDAVGGAVHAMRDATRGGVAACLNEWTGQSKIGIRIHETAIPVNPAVRVACELLGLDPLLAANEAKLLVSVTEDKAESLLTAMRAHPLGKNSQIIGEVTKPPARVIMKTALGAERIVDLPVGEQLPRIC